MEYNLPLLTNNTLYELKEIDHKYKAEILCISLQGKSDDSDVNT